MNRLPRGQWAESSGPCAGCDGILKAIRGPLPGIPFLPTNGVKVEEARDYYAAGSIALGFGREVFPPEALARKDFRAVETAARKLVEVISRARAV